MRPLSLAPQTIADEPPATFVRIARAVGFDWVGLRVAAGDPAAAPDMPCRIADDATAREVRRALDGEGVTADLLEFATLRPATQVAAFRPALERGAMLGTCWLLAAGDDPDLARRADGFAALAALAAEYRHRVLIEFVPWCAVATLPAAVALAEASGCGVLVDALHLARGGGTPADLARHDPALFPLVQLCDAPAAPPATIAELLRVASDERLDPGDGALPLAALLADRAASLEVPNRPRVAALGPLEHVRRARAAALALPGF